MNGAILLVVCDVSVDNEAPVVTLSILRFAGPTQFFEGAYRDRVCAHAFIGVSALVFMSTYVTEKSVCVGLHVIVDCMRSCM